MIKRKCLLNNLSMDVQRKSQAYSAVLIDLAVTGLLDKAKVEKLLGYEIPENIRPPVWSQEKPAVKQAAPVKTGAPAKDDDEDEE